jgi:phosphoribosyl 1,2-cyclic phosphodiesterase
MRVTFWGVRGSLPRPPSNADIRELQLALLREIRERGLPEPGQEDRFLDALASADHRFIGGNTSCVEVDISGQTIVFDAGSGIRPLGDALMRGSCGQGKGRVKLFLSHTHWDHIQGLPYFAPLYKAGNAVEIYSNFPDIVERLSIQQRGEFFPVPLADMEATVSFHTLTAGDILNFAGDGARAPAVRVRTLGLDHPGGCCAYRLEADGAALIYAADGTYGKLSRADRESLLHFFQGGDLLIFDSSYSFQEAQTHPHWGHASGVAGVDLALQAEVKKLILFHHCSNYTDRQMRAVYEEAMNYKLRNGDGADLKIILAREGMTLEVGGAQVV